MKRSSSLVELYTQRSFTKNCFTYIFVEQFEEHLFQGRRHWGVPPPPPPPTHTHTHTFSCSKKKKGKQRKARKTFKAESIKRLSLRSKLYCLSHSRVSRIQKKFLSANHGGRQYFSVFHGPSSLKSISPALFLAERLLVVASKTRKFKHMH